MKQKSNNHYKFGVQECPNSAVISDSCDYVGSQVCIIVEFSYPRIFKQDFVPFVICVLFFIVIFSLISLIN